MRCQRGSAANAAGRPEPGREEKGVVSYIYLAREQCAG